MSGPFHRVLRSSLAVLTLLAGRDGCRRTRGHGR